MNDFAMSSKNASGGLLRRNVQLNHSDGMLAALFELSAWHHILQAYNSDWILHKILQVSSMDRKVAILACLLHNPSGKVSAN